MQGCASAAADVGSQVRCHDAVHVHVERRKALLSLTKDIDMPYNWGRNA